MKKVLVTGGAGLIGSHLVDLLLEHKYKVKILDNLEALTHPNGKPSWINSDAEFIQGDVRNSRDWGKALKDVEFVFHQAAWGGFTPDISKFTDVNISGTAKLFETIRKNNLPVKKIVVASSQAVYGEGKYRCKEHGYFHPPLRSTEKLEKQDWDLHCVICSKKMKAVPIGERICPDVTGVYSVSKYSEERLSIAMGKDLGISTVALRYGLTYGPRQSIFNPYTGICSIFSVQILSDKIPVIFEDGKQTRDFIFVKDVAAANLFVLENPGINFEVFNVSTRKPTTVLEFVFLLASLYGKSRLKLKPTGEYRPLDLRNLVLDNRKIQELGWKPKYSLKQGLKEYVDWIITQDRPKVYFDKVLKQLRRFGVVKAIDK